jgi:hypothetical protein
MAAVLKIDNYFRVPVFIFRKNNVSNLSGQVKSGQRWSGQNRPTDVAGT